MSGDSIISGMEVVHAMIIGNNRFDQIQPYNLINSFKFFLPCASAKKHTFSWKQKQELQEINFHMTFIV